MSATVHKSRSEDNGRQLSTDSYCSDVFANEKLFATYECVKNSNVECKDFIMNNSNGTQKGILVSQPIDAVTASEKKSKINRSVSFYPNEEKQFADLSSSAYFGVKSYLHHFYEPITISDAFLKDDDFEFYIEPKNKKRRCCYIHCWKCLKFSFIIGIALLYTAGILCLFTMPEQMERTSFGIYLFYVTLIISFFLTFTLIWWMCSSIVLTSRNLEQPSPAIYSAVLTAASGKDFYNAKRIPLTGQLKAVQFEP